MSHIDMVMNMVYAADQPKSKDVVSYSSQGRAGTSTSSVVDRKPIMNTQRPVPSVRSNFGGPIPVRPHIQDKLTSVRTTHTRKSTLSRIQNGGELRSRTTAGNIIIGDKTTKKWQIRAGDVINLPVHTSVWERVNLAEGEHDGGFNVWTTNETGMVHSKRRFAVVLWKFAEVFLAAPMYTKQSKNLEGMSEEEKQEYICVKRINDAHIPQNNKGHLQLKPNPQRMDNPACYAHLAGGIKVNYLEDYKVVDSLTLQSYQELTKVWYAVNGAAFAEERKKQNLPDLPGLARIFVIPPTSGMVDAPRPTQSKWNGTLSRR